MKQIEMADLSKLCFIEVQDASNPSNLFSEWIEEANHFGIKPRLMNLATSTRNGKVSNRAIVIREILPNCCLAFNCQLHSNKVQNINENPYVAATLLLMYSRENEKISRQIRVSGKVEKLSEEKCKSYFNQDSLAAKIRSWICQESRAVEWDELKKKHDEMLEEVVKKKTNLEMPTTLVAFKIVPDEIDFYYSCNEQIADRVVFKKVNDNWEFQRVMT